MMMNNCYLAIDIGASSGRHILGYRECGKMVLEEIHRFDNRQVVRDGHSCWDMENIREGILEGLKKCASLKKIPKTIGIDTWGVDYVLLDENDELLGGAIAYRDSRTEGMERVVEDIISDEELYALTGIQKVSFNTIYQLTAQKKEDEEAGGEGLLGRAKSLLMIPDYLNFLLTGVKKQEYTNATTSGMVNAKEKCWDLDLIRRLGLPEHLFKELSMPGETVGGLRPEIEREVGFTATVVLPATHDTGSAFLAVPALDDNAVYLSSGTWSLLGVENEAPLTSDSSREQNFTNEGGAWYRYRYLKNIMGLWMIQSIRRELNGVEYVAGRESSGKGKRTWNFPELCGGQSKELTGGNTKELYGGQTKAHSGENSEELCGGKAKELCGRQTKELCGENTKELSGAEAGEAQAGGCNGPEENAERTWSFPDLIEAAKGTGDFSSVVDVNDSCFLAPQSMIDAILEQCKKTGQPVPSSVGEVMQCVYRSLAGCYRDTVRNLERLTGKTYTSINIVGGGCQDMYLNEMTAKAAALPVYAGPVEGTAIGNLLVQMIADKELKDLKEARALIRESFEIKMVKA